MSQSTATTETAGGKIAGISFRLSQRNLERIEKWQVEQDAIVAARQGNEMAYYGILAASYTFSFTPFPFDTVVRVKNLFTGEYTEVVESNAREPNE